MATITLQEAKCVQTSTGGPPELREKYEAAAQSATKRGEFCSKASGQITVVATGATAIDCMAAHDLTGTTNAKAKAYEGTDDNIFEVNVYHSVAASAVTNKNMVGVDYGIIVANNKHYLNMENTQTPIFHVVNLSGKDEEGDTYGRVLVRIKKSGQSG